MAVREIDLILTDFALHTIKKRGAKTFEASIRGKTPEGLPRGRFNGSINKKGEFEIPFPQEMLDQMARGELIVRCFVHKNGTPVFAGRDAEEKLKAENKRTKNKKIYGRTHVRKLK